MLLKRPPFLFYFLQISLSLLCTLLLIRLYEYFSVANKVFVTNAYKFELLGIAYDVWMWLILSALLVLPLLLLHLMNGRSSTIVFHSINCIIIVCYVGLILVFSERNTPFDHEFFTRSLQESIDTSKQMLTSSLAVYVPFIIYIALYFVLYYCVFKKIDLSRCFGIVVSCLAIVAVSLIKYSNPSPASFSQASGYYLASNKLTYWLYDSYHYFKTKDKFTSSKLNDKQLEEQVDFYQKNQPFSFTNKEYPLLHLNDEPDVLGSFFNFQPSPPNIVILVVEGLSSDFSGDRAYATSFTPFLDSLSQKSLVWYNFLSTAPGTFAAHPAISGSLPYGKKGFSIMNVMPDHLSLIKILKENGYYTNFMIGFNPDFDNMGGYIRHQGTDFILTNYPAKYKKMGVSKEGWSMGYPDDVLYNRSFEALDSIKQAPYLSIYHTATSHMPYLFEQKPQYEKLFDSKLKTLHASPQVRRTLRETKTVLTTFMFADDCIKKFIADYSKRTDFNNTIFFITGDHHIGSFPSTGEVDDFHVPFIVYSTMLKHPKKFLSVNSHNNIAPTITTLLLKNFEMQYQPMQVHWLGSVIDTAATFRNIHSMPFMSWSRAIEDYIYKDYFLSGEQLYKLSPELLQEWVENDSIKTKMIWLRDNFKIINSYVCDNNKIYPSQKAAPGNKQLLKEFIDTADRTLTRMVADTTLTPYFKVPGGYTALYVELKASVNLPNMKAEDYPTLRFALVSLKNNGKQFLYYSKREIATLSKGELKPNQWNTISTTDMFPLGDYKNEHDLYFETAIYTDKLPLKMKIRNLKVRIYGMKK